MKNLNRNSSGKLRQQNKQMVLVDPDVYMWENAIDLYLSPCRKLNSKRIKDLKGKRYTEPDRKELEDNLELIGTKHFLQRTPIAQALRTTINKQELMKLKNLCETKHTAI